MNVRSDLKDDMIPRFSWGKYFLKSSNMYVDLSIEVSYIFVDGYHIHLLLQEVEKTIEWLSNL